MRISLPNLSLICKKEPIFTFSDTGFYHAIYFDVNNIDNKNIVLLISCKTNLPLHSLYSGRNSP
jgi:hypothetical protein